MVATDDQKELIENSYTLVTPDEASELQLDEIPVLKDENVYILNDISDESVSKIDKIREILSEFSDRQDNANVKYSKEMKRSIEDGFEASTEKISTDIKPILEEHYKEISETDKKIEKISSNYENQFNLIVDSLQKAQNLSSKDVQILEKLVEAGKNELWFRNQQCDRKSYSTRER